MRMEPNVYDSTPRKLEDGLYGFEGGYFIWIEDGVLFLGAEVLPALVLLTCGRPLRGVEDPKGKVRFFIRAAHVMEESPKLAADIKLVAAKYQLSV